MHLNCQQQREVNRCCGEQQKSKGLCEYKIRYCYTGDFLIAYSASLLNAELLREYLNVSFKHICAHRTEMQHFVQMCSMALDYLMVYRSVPSSWILSSLLGMVMLWATDFFPLWKKVSGVQILLAIRLLRGRIFIGPLNFNLSSFQLWRKNTSMVYSCGREHDFASIHPFRNLECPNFCV